MTIKNVRLSLAGRGCLGEVHRGVRNKAFHGDAPPEVQTLTGGGGGVGVPPYSTSIYQLYMYVPLQRVWFLSRFGLKIRTDFDHYDLKSGMDFRGQVLKTGKMENRKWHVLVQNTVRIWRTGQHTPTMNSEEYPPRTLTFLYTVFDG